MASNRRNFIVKVQISVTTNAGTAQMLIYNKDRSIEYEGDAEPNVLQLMNGSHKEYFETKLVDDPNMPKAKKIHLLHKVKYQPW